MFFEMVNTKENKIEAIVFDVGGVISKGSFGKSFSKSISNTYSILFKEVYNKYRDTEEDYLCGRERQYDFFKRLIDGLNIPFEYERLSQLFLSSFELNKEVIDIIKKTYKKYDCIIASDNYLELANYITKKYNLKKYFKMIILSNELGMRKNKREFFQKIINSYNPEECVFIDDKEELLQIRREIGFKTIRFKNSEQLKKDLKKFGVEV